MRRIVPDQHKAQASHAGKEAREQGRGLSACPYGMTEGVLRGSWLQGWHDQDIETLSWVAEKTA